MAKEVFDKQLYLNSAEALDYKNQPVQTYNDLLKIPRAIRYVGLEVYVIAENAKYRLVGGTKDENWVIAGTSIDCGEY